MLDSGRGIIGLLVADGLGIVDADGVGFGIRVGVGVGVGDADGVTGVGLGVGAGLGSGVGTGVGSGVGAGVGLGVGVGDADGVTGVGVGVGLGAGSNPAPPPDSFRVILALTVQVFSWLVINSSSVQGPRSSGLTFTRTPILAFSPLFKVILKTVFSLLQFSTSTSMNLVYIG